MARGTARGKKAGGDPQTGSLGTHDGMEVIGVQSKITKAGDGLSKSQALDPTNGGEIHMHGRYFVLLEVVAGPVTYKPVPDTQNKVIRVHTLEAETVTLVDEEFAREKIADQKRKIEEARGVHELDFAGDEDGDGDGTFGSE